MFPLEEKYFKYLGWKYKLFPFIYNAYFLNTTPYLSTCVITDKALDAIYKAAQIFKMTCAFSACPKNLVTDKAKFISLN